jgi:hypothetical protein
MCCFKRKRFFVFGVHLQLQNKLLARLLAPFYINLKRNIFFKFLKLLKTVLLFILSLAGRKLEGWMDVQVVLRISLVLQQ